MFLFLVLVMDVIDCWLAYASREIIYCPTKLLLFIAAVLETKLLLFKLRVLRAGLYAWEVFCPWLLFLE